MYYNFVYNAYKSRIATLLSMPESQCKSNKDILQTKSHIRSSRLKFTCLSLLRRFDSNHRSRTWFRWRHEGNARTLGNNDFLEF